MSKTTQPTRRLTDQAKPHRYVPASHTSVARTIELHRRLLARQQAQHRQEPQ